MIRVSSLSALLSFQLKRPLPPIGYPTANQKCVATAPATTSHTSPESPALIFEFWILVGSQLIENAWTAQNCPEDCNELDFLRLQEAVSCSNCLLQTEVVKCSRLGYVMRWAGL